jgi:hypothetical protein
VQHRPKNEPAKRQKSGRGSRARNGFAVLATVANSFFSRRPPVLTRLQWISAQVRSPLLTCAFFARGKTLGSANKAK